jgi:hypothetical protein
VKRATIVTMIFSTATNPALLIQSNGRSSMEMGNKTNRLSNVTQTSNPYSVYILSWLIASVRIRAGPLTATFEGLGKRLDSIRYSDVAALRKIDEGMIMMEPITAAGITKE